MMFTDLVHDKPAYVQWLVRIETPLSLAYLAFDIIHEHLTVGNKFQLALQAMEPQTLAMLIANNANGGDFADEIGGDRLWRERCEKMYDDPQAVGVAR